MTTPTSAAWLRNTACASSSLKVAGVKTGIADASAASWTGVFLFSKPRRPPGFGARVYTAVTTCPLLTISCNVGTANAGTPMNMMRMLRRYHRLNRPSKRRNAFVLV